MYSSGIIRNRNHKFIPLPVEMPYAEGIVYPYMIVSVHQYLVIIHFRQETRIICIVSIIPEFISVVPAYSIPCGYPNKTILILGNAAHMIVWQPMIYCVVL